ncbi:MAG: 2-oxoacid:acceptor oxidoreductase subunit alpha [Bacteroidales bacterium]
MENTITIVLSGEAGQGIKTVEKLFVHSLKEEKLHFFSTSEVMSRVRGGNNTTEIRIGSPSIQSYKESIDVLIVLGKNGTERVEHRLHKDSKIIGEEKNIPESVATSFSTTYVPFKDIAIEAGNPVLTNTVILGYLFGILKLQQKIGKEQLHKTFKEKEEKIISQNIEAFNSGYTIGTESVIEIELPRTSTSDSIILNGTQAIGLGAIAGGCNFMAAYPMSPGTGVLEFLAHQAETFGIVVEQAEDEIAAINMTLGSWYAGGRAMTTTSGGGFALMEEGVSLSGMTEVPSVIHIGMRPGPATGLPTRTEQGDLMLAVCAGHGEFPKIVLAPGSPNECIHITQKAFNLAATYRVPVIILSDQFLLDSLTLTDKPDFSKMPATEKHITKTKKDFKTYEITDNGISPRGIPGYGNGFVCVDSDEHDETGRITEDADVRIAMVEKRLTKNELITQQAIKPTIIGDTHFSTLIISWGSTYGVIAEALENKKIKGLAYAHFSQVFPLPDITQKLTEQAKRIVVIENNASGQFAKLIQMELGIPIHENILQYNGFPFSIEYITSVIDSELSHISKK